MESKRNKLSIKKSLVFGFMVGFAVGYIIYRISIQINDGTGIIAKMIGESSVGMFVFVFIMLLFAVAISSHFIFRVVKDGLSFYRAYKRFKRKKYIKKYRYITS